MLECLVQDVTIPSEVLHNRIVYRFEFCLVQKRSIRTIHIQLFDHTRRRRVTTHVQVLLTNQLRLFDRRLPASFLSRHVPAPCSCLMPLFLLIFLHLRFRNVVHIVLPGISQLTDPLMLLCHFRKDRRSRYRKAVYTIDSSTCR